MTLYDIDMYESE